MIRDNNCVFCIAYYCYFIVSHSLTFFLLYVGINLLLDRIEPERTVCLLVLFQIFSLKVLLHLFSLTLGDFVMTYFQEVSFSCYIEGVLQLNEAYICLSYSFNFCKNCLVYNAAEVLQFSVFVLWSRLFCLQFCV